MKRVWIFIVRLFGWSYVIPPIETRPEMDHCVIAVAPHTSIYDFLVGATCLWKMGSNCRIFMKKEFFNWFTTPILRHFGVVPVDRGNRHNGLVEKAVESLRENNRFAVVITPEGTRKKVKRWKRGFYEIALEANVPIVLAYIDYKKKQMGIGPTVNPTGDWKLDFAKIMDFYKDITPKHPERFNRDIDN